jgi:hypothetical protein
MGRGASAKGVPAIEFLARNEDSSSDSDPGPGDMGAILAGGGGTGLDSGAGARGGGRGTGLSLVMGGADDWSSILEIGRSEWTC